MTKEKCGIGHMQGKIWAHLESVGVRAVQVMKLLSPAENTAPETPRQ